MPVHERVMTDERRRSQYCTFVLHHAMWDDTNCTVTVQHCLYYVVLMIKSSISVIARLVADSVGVRQLS